MPTPSDHQVYLGIAEGHSDPSVAAVRGGHVIAYAEEERFSRNKHAFGSYPKRALRYCLEATGVSLEEVGAVCLGWNLAAYSDGRIASFFNSLSAEWDVDEATLGWQRSMLSRFNISSVQTRHEREWRREFGNVQFPPIRFLPHHFTHAFQASMQSPFESALVLTIDGSGDEHTTVLWIKHEGELAPLRELYMPHSLGWFYAAFTEYLGFDAYDGEYKVMGLAAHGAESSELRDCVSRVLFPASDQIEFRLDPSYIHYGDHSYSARFTDKLPVLLGREPRLPSEPVGKWHADLAFAVQTALEESVFRLALWGVKQTGIRNLCIGGGVGLNVKMNHGLLELPEIDDVFAHPLCADGGASAGAALAVCQEDTGQNAERLTTLSIGPGYDDKTIEKTLKDAGIDFERPSNLLETVAQDLADGRIIGWFQGRMEAGPRALGQRSILADPRSPQARDRVNAVVKHREAWRPFGPAMLPEATHKYFDGSTTDSRFMMMALKANDRLRADAPAVVHADGTARVQLVHEEDCPDFHALLKAFERVSGVPAILNTSFNVRGEPIVCSPDDALRTFSGTGIDVLVMGDCIVRKERIFMEGSN